MSLGRAEPLLRQIQAVSPLKLKKDLPAPHTVPMMLCGDVFLRESNDILRFFDERCGAASRGDGPPPG